MGLTTATPLREKCPYSEFYWSIFSHIPTEYGEILHISPYSVRMRENTDQKNSKYGHFSRRTPYMRIMFVNDKKRAECETCRRIPIGQELLMLEYLFDQ